VVRAFHRLTQTKSTEEFSHRKALGCLWITSLPVVRIADRSLFTLYVLIVEGNQRWTGRIGQVCDG
jgi:hypothetical protein